MSPTPNPIFTDSFISSKINVSDSFYYISKALYIPYRNKIFNPVRDS